MPRKPDVACAGGCGRLLWGGRGSLANGERCCRECRANGLAPRAIEQPLKRTDRLCAEAGCSAKHFAKGMCRKHYYRARWADGKDGAASPTVVLNALCYRWGASAPKVKAIKCLHTVGILPDCPMCDRLMSPLSPDHFMCRSCWTEARFNAEEVAWLATCASRSTSQSRLIAS